MIIRSTHKVLNIAKIKPVKNEELITTTTTFPGDWYASLVSTGRRRGSAIHFLHNPTLVSIVILGKSLTKTLPLLPARVSALLQRNGYSKLEPFFQLDSKNEVSTSNDRSILGYITIMRRNFEYHLANSENLEFFDIEEIEDIHLDYSFRGKMAKGKYYITPIEKLNQLLEDLENQ